MIEFLNGLTQLHNLFYSVLWFVVILTVLVFVHESGHYLIARWNRVRVEVFSIGFGPELFGWWDRAGTRWKFSTIPLGGYVKMFGDSDASSGQPLPGLARLALTERNASFHYKRLGQRAAIVAAGPAANFAFAIIVLTVLFMTFGQPYTPAEVGQVQPGSAAEQGGIRAGDVILSIDGQAVARFEDVQQAVRMNPGVAMAIAVRRDAKTLTLQVAPARTEVTDRFGNRYEIGLLGIARSGMEYIKRDPVTALYQAVGETWNLSASTLQAMWQMVKGTRTTDELGGPLRIAQMSGEVARGGIAPILTFMALLSVSLGLINLFPVPILDGGHLLFYAAEAIRGRPLGQKAQEYGFRIGLALVLTLMVFTTWNDLIHIGIRGWFKL